MSLMRKLTSGSKKKSKSPPPTYSMDNPVFEDTSIMSHHTRYVENIYEIILAVNVLVHPQPVCTQADFND